MLKKRIAKVCSAALAFMMVSAVMGGCKGQGKVETDSTANQTGPKTTLTVEVFDRGKTGQPDLNNNYWTQYINKNFGSKYNCTVQFVSVPRSQELDKLNVLMGAGQAPDLCFTYDSGTVYKYVQQGGLTQLDSYLTKFGTTLTKYLGKDVLKYGSYNNKMYVVPAKRTVVAWTNTFIRKDWLDKLGLSLPKTTDDFYNDLVAFRDKNPGGVTGVVPMTFSFYTGSGNLENSFYSKLTAEQQAAYPLPTSSGNLSWYVPGYKDYVKFMNKLYNEKLISADFATDTTGSKENADVTNGKAGVIFGNWDYIYRSAPGLYAGLKKNVPSAELVPVDCFKNAQGEYSKEIYGPAGANMFVPKFSKNAAMVIKYLNWMADPKVTLDLQNGEEGIDYTLVDGIPKANVPSTYTGQKMQGAASNGDYDMLTNGIELGDAKKDAAAVAASYPGYENDALGALKISLNDGYPQYYFSTPNASLASSSSNLINKSKEILAKLIVCSPSQFDSLYTSSLADFSATGGQAALNENIKIYEAQTGKKST